MKLRRFAALAALMCGALFAQQTHLSDVTTGHDFMPVSAVPTSTTDALVPPSGAPSRVILRSLYLVNTNSSTSVTVTVTEKTTGNTIVVAAIPGSTTGGNNISVQFPADGISCSGGIRWLASGTGVNGYMTGAW